MHIGVDARSLTEPFPTGVSMYAFSIIQACALASPSDRFLLFTSGYHQAVSSWLHTLQQLPNVELHHLNWPNKIFHGAALFGVAPTLDKIVGQCDVFFAPNWHLLPLSSEIPLVLTVHDLAFKLYRQFLSFRRKVWHSAVRPNHLLQRANRIITVSETTRQDLLHHFQLPARTVTTIHSAVPSVAAAEPWPELPQRYCLALSTIEPRKNMAALVQAFTEFTQRHPNTKLDLVIIGSGGWKSSRIIQRMENHPRIHYFGYVTPGQKTTAISHAIAFLYPSIYEGFGFPPLEAIALGVPVIASRSGALPEILGPAAYYIDPYSIADMVVAFAGLSQDDIWRQQLVAQNQFLPQYDWKNSAAATLKVIHEAI